jgi:AcrR family transcriptional regulator
VGAGTAEYSSGMEIPQTLTTVAERRAASWSALSVEDKRERILSAAATVFSANGLEAPMSEVAAAAGAGVASIYRLFESKHGLFSALVIRRMGELEEIVAEAEATGGGNRWETFVLMLRTIVEKQSPEPFIAEARALVSDDPEVAEATARAAGAQERVLIAAREEGRMRADATGSDMRLMFAATRAARRLEPDSWSRMLQLLIDALDTQRPV